MARIRPHLSYANVIATLALFVALGGASYAAIRLPKDSVGARQIKKGAVTAPKLRNKAVGPAKLKNAAVTTAKLADNAVTGAKANEATFGTVPSADRAQSALTAQTAVTAEDAKTLGGEGPSSFLRSGRLLYGSASTDASTPQTVFAAAGVQVTTEASAGPTFSVRVANTDSVAWELATSIQSYNYVLGPGSAVIISPPSARVMTLVARSLADNRRAVLIQCSSLTSPNTLTCFGQVSPSA